MKASPSHERLRLLRQQWDVVKNCDVDFDNLRFGSGKKFWWQCGVADDHNWLAPFVKRIDGANCPMCAGRSIVKSNCLKTTHPLLAMQWHPEKNGLLTPYNVYRGSEKKVWWVCPINAEHEWPAQIKHRAVGGGCPICNGKTAIVSTSIATTHPHLVQEWHRNKNNTLLPTDVVSGSDKIVWWICKTNHSHQWQAPIKRRTIRNHGCPYCKGRVADEENNLAVKNPEISLQWNYEKNKPLKPEQFRSRSNKKVWWICTKNNTHIYSSTIANRVQGFGCPICAGRIVDASNSLQTRFPNIAKQWHPALNGVLTPMDIVAGSHRKFWWKCEKGKDHEWQSTSGNRIAGKNCPVCEGLKVVNSNCLLTTHPKLAQEWHPSKNENLNPEIVIAGSHKLVWWQCSSNPLHEWKASVKNRSSKEHGCPYCRLTPQSKQELTILFELKSIFSSINPKGHHIIHEGKRWALDIFIPELNLGVEFDGSYWHRDKEILDIQKNSICLANGIKIIRVREHPLRETSGFDITSKIPFTAKDVVNNILGKMISMSCLSSDKLEEINRYQLKAEAQATEQLDKYIKNIFGSKLKSHDG